MRSFVTGALCVTQSPLHLLWLAWKKWKGSKGSKGGLPDAGLGQPCGETLERAGRSVQQATYAGFAPPAPAAPLETLDTLDTLDTLGTFMPTLPDLNAVMPAAPLPPRPTRGLAALSFLAADGGNGGNGGTRRLGSAHGVSPTGAVVVSAYFYRSRDPQRPDLSSVMLVTETPEKGFGALWLRPVRVLPFTGAALN